MTRRITRDELRDDSDDIVRRVAAGESFIVTESGVVIGELIPMPRRAFASRDRVLEMFADAAPVDRQRLFADLDHLVDQDPAPPG